MIYTLISLASKSSSKVIRLEMYFDVMLPPLECSTLAERTIEPFAPSPLILKDGKVELVNEKKTFLC